MTHQLLNITDICTKYNLINVGIFIFLFCHVETHTINYHLKKIFSDSELQEDSAIRNFRTTALDFIHHFYFLSFTNYHLIHRT